MALKLKVTIGFLNSLCSRFIWDGELNHDRYATLEQEYSYLKSIIGSLFWFYGLLVTERKATRGFYQMQLQVP